MGKPPFRDGKTPFRWPAPPKKGKMNKQIIKGKIHYYHFKSKRWIEADEQSNEARKAIQGQTVHQSKPSNLNIPSQFQPQSLLSSTITTDSNSTKDAVSDMVKAINLSVGKFAESLK